MSRCSWSALRLVLDFYIRVIRMNTFLMRFCRSFFTIDSMLLPGVLFVMISSKSIFTFLMFLYYNLARCASFDLQTS